MSTFDVRQDVPVDASAELAAFDPSPAEEIGVSTLDILREASSNIIDRGLYVYENARGTIRLTMDANISQKELTRWQRAGLPPEEKKKRGQLPDTTKLDVTITFGQMIADKCVKIEVRRDVRSEYRPVADERTGELLTFADQKVLAVFGSPDRIQAVKKALLGSDPDLIECGTELQAKAGFGPGVDTEDDPLA